MNNYVENAVNHYRALLESQIARAERLRAAAPLERMLELSK